MSINPNPPNAWSRQRNSCTFIDPNIYTTNESLVYNSYINKFISKADAIKLDKQLYKGNILKYSKNSCNLTKSQQYSRLAKGINTLNKKSYAAQTDTYTNPNIFNLLRQNYTEISFLNTIVGSPNNISGPFQIKTINPTNCANNILIDGGNLVACTYVNPCTNEIIQQPSNTDPLIYTSTSSCDVPGKPEQLCWSSLITPWTPKTKYTMPTSNNGFPDGYNDLKKAYDASNLEIYLKTAYGINGNNSSNSSNLVASFSSNSKVNLSLNNYVNVVDVNRAGINNVTNTMLQNVQEQLSTVLINIDSLYFNLYRIHAPINNSNTIPTYMTSVITPATI